MFAPQSDLDRQATIYIRKKRFEKIKLSNSSVLPCRCERDGSRKDEGEKDDFATVPILAPRPLGDHVQFFGEQLLRLPRN